MRRFLGTLLILAGAAILILLRIGTDPAPCETSPLFVLQGTMDDCAARNPKPEVSAIVAQR
ncbi:MAG: hypothetical protein JWO52_4127 [Gammaproteobacteria bacterium]|jgi:hypothetical protein|nr:hypothetical protein [Gammaproteobacteria bacterium]